MSLTNHTKLFPFEFCAARYLRAWESREQALFSSIKSKPTDLAIADGLRYFRVARNFRGLSTDPGAVKDVRRMLLKVIANRSLAGPETRVDALAKLLLDSQFKQYNLSASSKLLWLFS